MEWITFLPGWSEFEVSFITTVSYDLYKTLQEALMSAWDPKTVLPTKGLNMINKLELTRRGISIYRIVKVVAAPN